MIKADFVGFDAGFQESLDWFIGKFASSLTVYTAPSVSCAAVAGFIAFMFDKSLTAAFVLGLCLPVAPVYCYQSSERVIRRRLEFLKSLKDLGHVPAKQYEAHCKAIMDFYAARHYPTPVGGEPRTEKALPPELAPVPQPKKTAPGQ